MVFLFCTRPLLPLLNSYEQATIKKYLIVQTEVKREVTRTVDHYNLQAIIAVGFKVENERAVQFFERQLSFSLIGVKSFRVFQASS